MFHYPFQMILNFKQMILAVREVENTFKMLQ